MTVRGHVTTFLTGLAIISSDFLNSSFKDSLSFILILYCLLFIIILKEEF